MFGLEKHQGIAFITDRKEVLTYPDLLSEINHFSGRLEGKGLLFCLCKNRLASIIGYIACIEHHIPVVLLDGAKEASMITDLIQLYRPKYIWAPTDRMCEFPQGRSVYHLLDYTLLVYEWDCPVIHPDVSLLLTTSGSTGSPKLVKLTERNLFTNAEAIAEYLRIEADEKPITSLPMYYSFGMSVINSHLIKGATILLTDKTLMQKDFWTFFKDYGATSIAGVPYTYEMLRRLRFFRMDLPSLKTMIQAGGKLNADLVKEYVTDAKSKGREFIVMYGQTEAGPRMSWLPFEFALEKCSSIGIAIPGGRLYITDTEGRIITAPNVDGELVFEGPGVCMGYAEIPDDLAKGDENHGVLHTGDIARFDEDGFFYITGRMKRFVKVWGNRCNLDATEQLVKEITMSCACVGVDDKITIFVTEPGIEDRIVNHLVAKMNLHASAFDVRILPVIPKKDTGKIDYPALSGLLS